MLSEAVFREQQVLYAQTHSHNLFYLQERNGWVFAYKLIPVHLSSLPQPNTLTWLTRKTASAAFYISFIVFLLPVRRFSCTWNPSICCAPSDNGLKFNDSHMAYCLLMSNHREMLTFSHT